MKVKVFYIVLFTYSLLALAQSSQCKSSLDRRLLDMGMIDVHSLDATILIDIKYATTDNFTGVVLYDSLFNLYLHPLAADKLVKAQRLLKNINPNYSLLVYDGARPLNVQRRMYSVVKGTSKALYVAPPERRGLHNFGMAVDLTICDKYHRPLDMGTEFDHLGPKANINTEQEMLAKGILSVKQIDNRRLLRKIMLEAGFRTIRGEWWHFNAVTLAEAWTSYKVIE